MAVEMKLNLRDLDNVLISGMYHGKGSQESAVVQPSILWSLAENGVSLFACCDVQEQVFSARSVQYVENLIKVSSTYHK